MRKRLRGRAVEFEAVLDLVVADRSCSHILDLERNSNRSFRRVKAVTQTATVVSAFQQVRVFGMLFNIALYERAFPDHLQSIGPHLVERALHQPGADALASALRRHVAMDEGDNAVRYLVIG